MNSQILYYQRKENIPDDLIYKKAAQKQMCFVRDKIGASALGVPVFVVSWHRSKSVMLPVYGIVMKNGIVCILRDNFYDWKLSVKLPKALKKDYLPVDVITGGLTDEIHDCYCEGFRKEWVYGKYVPGDRSCKEFTIEIHSDYNLYMIMYLLGKAFPDMQVSEDELTDKELRDALFEIYEANGFNEEYEKRPAGSYKTRLMAGWEIMYDVYRKFDRYRIDKCDKYDAMDISNSPDAYIEEICSNPELKKTFILYHKMFSYKF